MPPKGQTSLPILPKDIPSLPIPLKELRSLPIPPKEPPSLPIPPKALGDLPIPPKELPSLPIPVLGDPGRSHTSLRSYKERDALQAHATHLDRRRASLLAYRGRRLLILQPYVSSPGTVGGPRTALPRFPEGAPEAAAYTCLLAFRGFL